MAPDLAAFLPIAAKLAVTAAFVVTASMITERTGPFIGALVSTLPISAGPTYVFLSLDHTAAFISEGALASFVGNTGNALFAFAYAVAAQRRSLSASLAIAMAPWLACAYLLGQARWSLPQAILLNLAVFAVCLPAVQRFAAAPMPPARRRWYDIPLRASLVATLVGVVIGLSNMLGPTATGMLAVFPVILASLALILHPRIGGPAAAAVLANTQWGLIGFSAFLLALHLAAVPLGAPLAFCVAFAVAVIWNVSVWAIRSRGSAHAKVMARSASRRRA